ncbi:uncharacterized protein [Littorina saxatilis]|uniref:uncharacterized protein isoform X2 n=1 Tax=Littorina saxatilis TaxID=31220 RepID=UPI0038B4A87F
MATDSISQTQTTKVRGNVSLELDGSRTSSGAVDKKSPRTLSSLLSRLSHNSAVERQTWESSSCTPKQLTDISLVQNKHERRRMALTVPYPEIWATKSASAAFTCRSRNYLLGSPSKQDAIRPDKSAIFGKPVDLNYTFSLSQQTNVMLVCNDVPCGHRGKSKTGSPSALLVQRRLSTPWKPDGEAVIPVPANRHLKDFQRDFYKRALEAVTRRRSLRCRKRWLTGYRRVHTVLRICQNMAERSAALEALPSTYVDIGDGVTATVDYGNGRSIDTEQFKRRKEISISSRVTDVLTSNPADRTLIQIEEARRELQKVEVFSEYPIDVQEHLIRRAFYVNISPKRIIVRRGHDPLYFYIIICGQAYAKDLEADPVTGEMRAKAAVFLKTGQSFGAAALISGQGHTTTVISRTNMQLLAINGEDYLEAFWYPSLRKELPPRLVYISKMNFMENFPIHLIKEKLNICTMHHFRRNTVITHDSRKSRNLFIVKFGYCKVFRKLDWQELPMEDVLTLERKSQERKTSELIQDIVRQEIYIERESPYVNYYETRSPQGNTVRVPVTRVPRLTDKLQSLPLTLPAGKRQFVPLMLLREGEVFVSLGAEVIALNKDFYCRHAAKEAKEVSDKTFIYDDNFIKRRVRERVNRDVHLEEVLNHYFHKVTMATSELCRTTDVTMI